MVVIFLLPFEGVSNVYFVVSSLSTQRLYRFAKIAPEILCHTEKIAPGTVAIARFGNAVPAREVARPEFCIPISMEIAFVFALLICNSLPSAKPHQCSSANL